MTALTTAERERIAYINGDKQTTALLDLIDEFESERKAEDLADTFEGRGQELQDQEAVGWCLGRVADALRAARPLKKSQMVLLASALESFAEQLPKRGSGELAFKACIDRICGLPGARA